MANISPKLFQKAIQQGLKTALFTTSTAAIMLSSSGALGVAAGVISVNDAAFSDLAAANNWNEITAGGAANGNPAGGPQDNEAFTYGGDHTITADEAGRVIQAINVAGTTPGALGVTQNTIVGSIVTGGNLLPVTIADGKSLTLTGTDAAAANHGFDAAADTYTGLGAITLNGAAAGLTINSINPGVITLGGTIDGGGAGQGALLIITDATFNAAVGATESLASITANANLDATTLAATNIIVNNAVTATGTVNGAISLAGGAGAQLQAGGLVTGNAVFNSNGNLILGKGINGAVTTAGNNTGTLTVVAGNVTGAIGTNGGAILKVVQFEDQSNVTSIDATTVTINNGAADVTAAGAITAAVNFAADGRLTANRGITGAVTTANNNEGTLVVGGGDVTGAIGTNGDNILKQVAFRGASTVTTVDATTVTISNAAANVTATGAITAAVNFGADGALTANNGIDGAVTTGTNNTGKLIIGAGDVTGAIGVNGGNILNQVTFNGASNVTSIDATTVTVNNAATNVTAAQAITAAVNFAADGALTANNGITGAVTAAGGNGTLTTAGVGVTGAVGTNAASLKVLNTKVNNGAADLVFGSDIYAQTVNFDDIAGGGAVGTIQAGGNLVATAVNFSADVNGGTLEFNGPLDGGGNVIPYQFKGAIVNGNNATLNVNRSLTAYHPSAGTIARINIGADNLFAFDASAGDVTILDGQAIAFGNADSALALSNLTGVGVKNILLAADLAAPGANEGQLIFDGGPNNGLNIGSNAAGTARKIGDGGGDKFNTLLIFKVVTITNDVDLEGIQQVIVNNNADFTSNTAVNADAVQIFDGTYRVDAAGGNVAVPAANIDFAHADAELVLQNSSNTNDRTITLGADIDPNNDDEGIVTLNSVNAGRKLTIAGGVTLGGAHRLQAIRFQGAGDFGTAGITFNTANIELDTTGATELGATPGNVILINNAVQLTQTGNIGGFLDFNGTNGTVTLNNGVNIAGAVQNTGGTNGTLIVLGASNLGSINNGLTMLKVGAGAVTIGGAGGEVTIGEIRGNGTNALTLPANFKLTGAINSGGGDPLKLIFSGNSSVSGVVGAAASPVGDITTTGTTNFASSVNAKGAAMLGGTTSFADTFTNTGAVTLAKASITNFAKNVTATSFAANNATINFGNSLAFNSAITGSGTTLTLGTNQVTYTGTGSFTDTLTLNTTFDGAAKSGGNILIKSGSTLDLSGVSTLALVVTATNFDINNISPDTKYTVISAETAGGLKPTPEGNVKITINNDNRFVDFTFDASTLTLFAEDIAEDVIDEDFEPGGPLANIPNAANIEKSLKLMAAAPNGSDARQALDNFGLMTPQQEADAVTHLMQDVVKPSDTIAAINNQVILSNISSSLINLNARMDAIQPAAVAAGDEDRDAKFGAWISPFVGNATRKMRNNISGYKSDTTGGTIGFDGLVNDDLALGLAYTRADTDIKLKNNKTGDKNKVQSNIYSVYGLYNVPYENLFVEAIASYSDNRIKSKSRRVIATALETVGYQTASGKYKSESYTGQLMAGYTYMMPENINLKPLAGLRYSAIKDKGYKETGTTNQNLTVKGKNYNSFDGLLGAKVSSNINVNEEVVLTPELYAMVDYAFKNKVPAIDARLQGMTAPFPTNSFKQSKTSFDVGVGVTAKHKMMEYGINYDTNIGSKYFAQQGSVKVRVNF